MLFLALDQRNAPVSERGGSQSLVQTIILNTRLLFIFKAKQFWAHVFLVTNSEGQQLPLVKHTDKNTMSGDGCEHPHVKHFTQPFRQRQITRRGSDLPHCRFPSSIPCCNYCSLYNKSTATTSPVFADYTRPFVLLATRLWHVLATRPPRAAALWHQNTPHFWSRDRIHPISTFLPQNPIPGAHGAADARGPGQPDAGWSPEQWAQEFCSFLGNGAKS